MSLRFCVCGAQPAIKLRYAIGGAFFFYECESCKRAGPTSDDFDPKNDYAVKIAKTTALRRWNKARKEK